MASQLRLFTAILQFQMIIMTLQLSAQELSIKQKDNSKQQISNLFEKKQVQFCRDVESRKVRLILTVDFKISLRNRYNNIFLHSVIETLKESKKFYITF